MSSVVVSTSSIAVLCPVLGRREALRPMYESLVNASSVPWRLYLLCSPQDDDAEDVCLELEDADERVSCWTVDWEPEHADWAKKINYAYEETAEDFLLLGATDLRFHAEWDVAALRVAEENGAGVIGTNDLGNATVMRGFHSTHPLVRREYIDEHGTIDEEGKVLHEGYAHQWVDTELVETAKVRGAWAFAEHSRVEHLHPFWRKGRMDSTYTKALSTSDEDHRYYAQRQRLWKLAAKRARISAS